MVIVAQPLIVRSRIARELGGSAEIRKLAPVYRRIEGARITHELGKPLAERTLATRAFLDKCRFGDFDGAKKLVEEFSYLEKIAAELETAVPRAVQAAKNKALSEAVRKSLKDGAR